MAAVALAFDETERIPAVAQDAATGEVLMLAYVTEEALERTRETGLAHYYSRSRDELWQKGQSSGHVQEVEEIRVDCDGDTLLYLVSQEGGACHTGHRTCFYRTIDGETVGEKVFEPDDVYETDGGHVPEGEHESDGGSELGGHRESEADHEPDEPTDALESNEPDE